MNIGFLGAGHICEMVAPALKAVSNIRRVAVASRSLERARRFAQAWGFERAYGSYQDLVDDPDVDVIYIGTPHSFHFEHIMLCLDHGKGVICEKAFCLNVEQTRMVIEKSRQKGLFLAEAMWIRYMPSLDVLRELLNNGSIGTPHMLTATLCYPMEHKERLVRPELGGGALLDVGVYPLNFAMMLFGDQMESCSSQVVMHPTGVDGMECITLVYPDGRMAVLTAGMYSRSDRQGIIHGDKGYMVVENINNPQSVSVYDNKDRLLQHIRFPQKINGYEYEFEAIAASFDAGKTEVEAMPQDTTIAVMEVCDTLRKQWGMVFPGE